MPGRTAPTRSTIVPRLRYRDAPAAIDFLCAVLGFERHLVVPGADGGRGFTCADPGAHLWSVGSYDPWAGHT